LVEGLGAGADDFIPKSSDFEVLKARVRAQLRRKQFEDETRRIREELLSKELEANEARAARELAATRAVLLEELERKNKELEAFSYSVSHDLRAPLRGIDGFSQALLEDHAANLDDKGRDYLKRVRAGAQRMGVLIDDMLQLFRVSRAEMRLETVDLTRLARDVVADMERQEPERDAEVQIEEGLKATGDANLVRIVLDNLLRNAWKFASKIDHARIEVGTVDRDGLRVFFVRDNGAGFDMQRASKLFGVFQRLHLDTEFPGTGIGLATVRRIVERHGGRVWARGAVGMGATFWFTLERSR
jgi:light-regulated signal transduction histidine kinase (bacteriophytochrome)